jgi:VanZ family protein
MKFLQILTLIWTALIFTFSIIKPPTAGTIDTITLHFAAYAFLAVLALSSTAGKRLKVFAAVVCYGIALEILQNFTGRTFSPIDITANCIGALAATAVFCLVNRQNS